MEESERMDLGLTNQVALVAAASQGIGYACALKLAEAGAIISMCARNPERLETAASTIRERTGATVWSLPVDVTQPDQIEAWIQQTVDRFNQINILVTNAGGPPATPFMATGDGQWQKGVDLTLMSVIRLIRGVIPHFQRVGGGQIVNITSVSVYQPIPRLLMSNVIRPAVHGLTKSLADEYAAENIRINNVCPGYTLTERVQELVADKCKSEGVSEAEALAMFTSAIPMRRMAQPAEIANAVLFYASTLSSYVTGTSLLVDGGFVKANL